MADSFGAVTVPLPAPEGGAPTTDPALGLLLDYLKAFLVKDQAASLAWQVPGIDPAHPPVVGTFVYDPTEVVFSSADLPALYCWRDGGKEEWIADDVLLETTTVKLVWVFPLGKPEDKAPRSPFMNGLVKAVNVAIERGRTPSWRQPNDPDPVAKAQGSFIGNYLGMWALWLDSWKPTHIIEKARDGSVRAIFQAIEMKLVVQENMVVDTSDPSRFQPTSPTSGADITLTQGASGEVAVEGLV